MATLKPETSRFLVNVPEEYAFWSYPGHTLRNMKELGDELRTMSNENYAYHVNAEKNDFANWVKDIIKDEKLAADLKKAPDRVQAARAVANRIAILSRR